MLESLFTPSSWRCAAAVWFNGHPQSRYLHISLAASLCLTPRGTINQITIQLRDMQGQERDRFWLLVDGGWWRRWWRWWRRSGAGWWRWLQVHFPPVPPVGIGFAPNRRKWSEPLSGGPTACDVFSRIRIFNGYTRWIKKKTRKAESIVTARSRKNELLLQMLKDAVPIGSLTRFWPLSDSPSEKRRLSPPHWHTNTKGAFDRLSSNCVIYGARAGIQMHTMCP